MPYSQINSNIENYSDYLYEHGKGLDCSGYTAWMLYNTLFTYSGDRKFEGLSKDTGYNYQDWGFGYVTSQEYVYDYKPGDVMFSGDQGHVWVCMGKCADGSVVVMHSSPKGVQINGTTTPSGSNNSQAVFLANAYMKKYFTNFTDRYGYRTLTYLGKYNQFTWDLSGSSVLIDPDGIRNMTANQVLNYLIGPI